MRLAILVWMIVAGLSGCATRNPVSSEQLRLSRDSISYARLDTSCLHYNRGAQLRGLSRLKEISLSVPDSSGSQYVERIIYATEEWGMRDSAEIVSVSANTVNGQGITSSGSFRQEVIKNKTNRRVWWIFIPLVIFLIYLLRRRWRIYLLI